MLGFVPRLHAALRLQRLAAPDPALALELGAQLAAQQEPDVGDLQPHQACRSGEDDQDTRALAGRDRAFITVVGLKNAGFVVQGGELGTLGGHLGSWKVLVFVLGLLVSWTLYVRGVHGALLIGILGATCSPRDRKGVPDPAPTHVPNEALPRPLAGPAVSLLARMRDLATGRGSGD